MDARKATAALRIFTGAAMLYAGFEKVTAAKAFDAAGFLKFATNGTAAGVTDTKAIVNPTHDLWVSLAGSGLMPLVNFLVVFGECALGVALILGIATRLSGVLTAVLMGLFTVASWNFANGPFNETVFYAAAAITVVLANAGSIWSISSILERRGTLTRLPAVLARAAF